MPEHRKLTRADVEAIRNGQLLLPAREIDARVLDACGSFLTAGETLELAHARQETWTALKQQILALNHHTKIRRRRARMVAIAVLVLLMIATLCYATGLFTWIQHALWNSEQYDLVLTPMGNPSTLTDQQRTTENSDDFANILVEHGMQPPLPGWIPKGYALLSADVYPLSETWVQAIAVYAHGENRLFVQVDRFDISEGEIATKTEKDGEPIETFTSGGISVAVYENLGHISAIYAVAPYIVDISGDGITREQLHQMIETMGGTL